LQSTLSNNSKFDSCHLQHIHYKILWLRFLYLRVCMNILRIFKDEVTGTSIIDTRLPFIGHPWSTKWFKFHWLLQITLQLLLVMFKTSVDSMSGCEELYSSWLQMASVAKWWRYYSVLEICCHMRSIVFVPHMCPNMTLLL